LNSENWQKEFSLPIQGGLVQPALASQNVALYKKMKELADAQINVSMSVPQLFVFGGFSPATDNNPASVNQDVWNLNELSPEWVKSFNPFPSGETKNSLSGGVAVAFQDSLILTMGGVNQQVFEDALNRNFHLSKVSENNQDTLTARFRSEAKAYLHHPAVWYKFNDEVWLFNVRSQEWKSLGKFPQAALAGASAVGNDNEIYIVNGEIKPGIRTPKIWKITW
jgi:N-acetylneuraminic acid mutarotase